MKKKNRNKTRKRRSLQPVTLCISTAMVLVLLGLVVMTVLATRNLTTYVKENLTVTVMLNDDIDINGGHEFCRQLYHRPYTRYADYISKDEALAEQTKALGSDPSEFIGTNPFSATIELRMNSDYASQDSLRWIKKELLKRKEVTDVAYQADLVKSVNENLRKVSIVLLALAALLLVVSFSLISNTVRLGVYARRFTIRTMKLVGASWNFIRWPFIRQALGIALCATLLACAGLGGIIYGLFYYEPALQTIISWQVLTITGVSVWVLGFLITVFCTYVSVNKFLNMSAGELYKV